MSIQIDPRFKRGSKAARERRARQKRRRLAIIGGSSLGGLFFIAAIWLLVSWGLSEPEPVHPSELAATTDRDSGMTDLADDEDFTMVQVAASAEADLVAVRAPFIDIAKDPMILHFENSGNETRHSLAGPAELPVERVGPLSPSRLTLIRDDLVLRETQIVTRIPSSRADLALFQASRNQGIAALAQDGGGANGTGAATDTVAEEAEQGELIEVDGSEGSWGALISGSDGPGEDTASFIETQIQNTTSVAFILDEAQRQPLYEDTITVLRTERSLSELAEAAGLDPDEAARLAAQTERRLSVGPTLSAGHIVAIRASSDAMGTRLQQMSLYDGETYLGTMAWNGAGRYTTGADPWIEKDLIAQGQAALPNAAAVQEVRLLDAVYSAAIRNGLPSSLVGELIVMMSQAHDLDRFAAVGDRMTLLMADTPGPRGQGKGRILFAGIKGPSGTLDCYVIPESGGAGFGCFRNRGGGGGGGSMGGGLVVPVSGTKTSGFGPRMHPILHQLRNHNGVDWAAPTGTPVMAAAAGKVAVAGPGGGYGNVVYIDHSGGLQTRYAHLNGFAKGISAGVQVRAGQLIGYVGTTGRSTGPHLHFELHVNGKPVDPLTYNGPAAGGGTIMAGGASDAVEALVNRIIQVESGGKADAANPNSTALGLGQFIKGTWLRMMRTYRPDLVASMSEADLLALRTNPDLSREMVRNLAREGEAYLRARGHRITPGRLYLAHFLGPAGADKALSSDPNLSVEAVMGASVVNANGFLRDKTIGDLWAWADRKMGQRGSVTAATRRRAVPPEVKAFIDLIKPILAEDS
ncbi:MAG: peptidase M23 [Rhodobacterales bacterium]|nr:MAG: peptidase M23 [Rhodobacterales bacterium]